MENKKKKNYRYSVVIDSDTLYPKHQHQRNSSLLLYSFLCEHNIVLSGHERVRLILLPFTLTQLSPLSAVTALLTLITMQLCPNAVDYRGQNILQGKPQLLIMLT